MSTEDIKIVLAADEARAVAALAKLEKTTRSVEAAFEAINQEGQNVTQTLDDLSKYTGSGGPFDSLKNESSELKAILSQLSDINWSDIVGKVSHVWDVSYRVGDAIGRWTFGVDEFNTKFAEAIKTAEKFQSLILKSAVERATAMSLEQIQKEIDGYSASINRLTEQQKKLNEEQYRFELAADKESVAMAIRQQEELRDALLRVQEVERQNQARPKNENQQLMQTMGFRNEQEAQAYRDALYEAELYTQQMAKEQSERESLTASQENYLSALDSELVRLRDGEEAYLRLTMAKQGFEQATIDTAIAMQAEIDAIKQAHEEQLRQQREAESKEKSGTQSMVSAPGQVQGTQARFITRGTGSSVQDKILEATRKQIEQQRAILEEQKKTARILEKVARDPM